MPPLDTASVLVVDDDAVSRHVLMRALADADLRAHAVTGGDEAIAYLKTTRPSLILLDLVMPPPDGLAVLQLVRSTPGWRELPVVILTALEADEDIARVFESGADDFVRKPFRPVELIARIRGQLRLRGYIDEIARKETDARIVLELTQALASSLDLREILFTVVQRIAEVAHVDRCSIVVAQEGSNVGHVAATSDDHQLQDLQIDLDKYPEIRQVMSSGETLVIENTETHPLLEVVRENLHARAVASLALVPINYEDKPTGVLFLRARQQMVFGEHELSVARTVANATAIALRNARVVKRLRDKTERVTFARFKAERRLRLLKRYETFLESAADGILVIDNDGQIVFSNARARDICGYTEAELRGRDFETFLVDQDPEKLASLREGFQGGTYPRNADFRIRRSDGREIVLSINFSDMLRQDNAVLLSLRDVTHDRMLDAELKRTKEFLERVIDSSANAIFSTDRDGVVTLFNRASERCFGYTSDEVKGRLGLADLFPAESLTDVLPLIGTRAETQRPRRIEDRRSQVFNVSHELVPVSLSAAPIFHAGHNEGAVIVLADLRDKLRMEARLAAAQEELQTRERQAIIAELAGAAAHELNQPLTSVMGYAELLKRKLDPDAAALEAADVIMNEAERMAEIVRKIGKITRYETKSYVGAAKILDLDRASEDPLHRR